LRQSRRIRADAPAQTSALAAKGAWKGAADELERLVASLAPVLEEERATAVAQGRALAAADAALAAAIAPPPRPPTPPPPPPPVAPQVVGLSPAQAEALVAQRVATLMEALYLSRLFDVTEEGRPTFGAQMERSAALSWDGYRMTAAEHAATQARRLRGFAWLAGTAPAPCLVADVAVRRTR